MLKSDESIIFKSTTSSDLLSVKALLTENQLPIGGVEDQFDKFILACTSNSRLIGCIGLEIYEQFGLVRSLAVQSTFQRKSIGSKLVEHLEQFAKEKNITELYLLTETAQSFFSRLGYEVIARDIVPKQIQSSYEYSTACAVSAIVMKKIFS